VSTTARRWPRLASTVIIAAVAAGAAVVAVSAGSPQSPAQAAAAAGEAAECATAADPQAPGEGSVDAFLKVDGVTGGSTDGRFHGASEIRSVRAGISSTSCEITSGVSVPEVIVVEKAVDRASVTFAALAATGKHFRDAKISFRITDSKSLVFLTYTLYDARVLSVRQVFRGGIPAEVVTFAYASIMYEYVPRKNDGSPGAAIEMCFDFKANKECG
jgi:type VI protein secretion system component Hcp